MGDFRAPTAASAVARLTSAAGDSGSLGLRPDGDRAQDGPSSESRGLGGGLRKWRP